VGIIASQPAFVAQYGAPKKGKTTDCLFSFPRAKWVAAPGALKPSVGVCGYEPPDSDQHNVDSVKQATALVEAMDPTKYDALVVDDLTLLVDRTVAELSKRGVSGSSTDRGGEASGRHRPGSAMAEALGKLIGLGVWASGLRLSLASPQCGCGGN